MNMSLFGEEENPLRAKLKSGLRALADRNIFLGTSSWNYPGWMGKIYTEQRYLSRGKFSEKRFQAECLAEFSEVFPSVCGDFSFYRFHTQDEWQRKFALAAPQLMISLKVPQEVTIRRWPKLLRHGASAGKVNESFLDLDLFRERFLRPLESFQQRIGVLIFEFGSFNTGDYESAAQFAIELDNFLKELPSGWRYAVEIRNREFLVERHFDVLRRHGVAHVFSSWTRMPELSDQIKVRDAYTADFLVARALVRPGRSFEQAVQLFEPYTHIQDPYPSARQGLRQLISDAQEHCKFAYLFAGNRLEGFSPGTIAEVISAPSDPL